MGRASISIDPALTQSFLVEGKAPRAVLLIAVEQVFYQCAKAIVRSKLWEPVHHIDRKSLPSAGMILADLTGGKLGGPEHDRTAPERLQATINWQPDSRELWLCRTSDLRARTGRADPGHAALE